MPTYGARARSVSSMKMRCSVGVAPRPPNSLGQLMPAYPASNSVRCQPGVPGAAGVPVLAVGLGPEAREHVAEPLAQLGAELLLVGRVPEIHRPRERI